MTYDICGFPTKDLKIRISRLNNQIAKVENPTSENVKVALELLCNELFSN